MARERVPDIRVARQRAELARARAESAARPPDPSLDLYREQAFADPDAIQDIVSLTFPIDLSGRRRGERALLRSDAARSEMQAALGERTAIARALGVFYAAIAAGERVAAAEARVEALGEVERVLAEREAAGTASGYERARLGIEADLARSRLASRRAEAKVSRDRLALLVAPEVTELPALESDLSTSAPPAASTLLEQAGTRHPALGSARDAEAAAKDAEDAADTAWIPTIALTGGYNVVRGGGTSRGYVAGIGLTLPIFSRDQGLGARASARRRLARAEERLLERRLRRQVSEARSRLIAAREELTRFERAAGERVTALLEGARVSYEEGRRPLLEVLDAQRVATEVRLRQIELALAAKRAEIALERVTGGWE